MKLNAEQLKSIAVGVARVEEKDGKVYLLRFTKEQEELYKETNADFYKKTFATAGVRLEFITDSRTLSMETEQSSGSSRKYFQHSIFVDGKKYANLGAKSDFGAFGGKWTLPDGEKKIAIYFPWSTCSAIKSFELDDGASIVPAKKTHTMISFGDSITHGYDASSPELSYASKLADALDADSRNKGIGGEIFRPELAMLSDGISPDYISVAYGTNDWSACDIDTFKRNCRGFYEALAKNYPEAKIFAFTPIWRKDIQNKKTAGEFHVVPDFIEELAKEIPNMIAINCLPFIPEDISCFSKDGVHPNDKGFDYYAEGAVNEVKKHL